MEITISTSQKDLYDFFESDDFKEEFRSRRYHDSDLRNESPAYYTIREFFCNSHDDTAVEVKVFNCYGQCIGGYIFKWPIVDEVASENLWILAERYAEYLEKKYNIKWKSKERLL